MMQKVASAIFLVLVVSLYVTTEAQPAEKDRACPLYWMSQVSKPDMCYYISNESLGHQAADKSCKDMSSSLLSVSSAGEHEFISQALRAHRRDCKQANEECVDFWIGLQTSSSGSSWTHGDGSQISPTDSFWDKGYPSGKDKCGLMHLQDNDQELIAYWRDENCDKQHAYVCKQERSAPVDKTSNGQNVVQACPEGFVQPPNSDNCYKIVGELLTNADASQRCRGFGNAQLAIIQSLTESVIVRSYLVEQFDKDPTLCLVSYWEEKNQAVWYNGQMKNASQCEKGFVWKNADGIEVEMNYTNWYPSQPDCNRGVENCIASTTRFEYNWKDASCDWKICAVTSLFPLLLYV